MSPVLFTDELTINIFSYMRKNENEFKYNIKKYQGPIKQSATLIYETECIRTLELIIVTMF